MKNTTSPSHWSQGLRVNLERLTPIPCQEQSINSFAPSLYIGESFTSVNGLVLFLLIDDSPPRKPDLSGWKGVLNIYEYRWSNLVSDRPNRAARLLLIHYVLFSSQSIAYYDINALLLLLFSVDEPSVPLLITGIISNTAVGSMNDLMINSRWFLIIIVDHYDQQPMNDLNRRLNDQSPTGNDQIVAVDWLRFLLINTPMNSQ